MKLTFFLIAFFLVLLRVYFSWAGFMGHNRSDRGNMLIKGNNYIEELHWSGKIRLSDDEKSIADMTPGGYLTFRENDQTLKAESNLQGEIAYTLYDGRDNLALNDSGRRFISAVLQKMIARGFYSDGRAQRIAQRGGNQALLAELPHLEMEGTDGQYLDLLFKSDSLTAAEQIALLRQISNMGDDEKEKYLTRFTPARLKDSSVALEWLAIAGDIGPDDRKKNLLIYYFGHVADSAGLPDDKKTDAEWIRVIRVAAMMGDDNSKSEVLVRIAQKMPKDDSVKAEYKTAARTIRDDADYGKAIRAVE